MKKKKQHYLLNFDTDILEGVCSGSVVLDG